MTLPGHISRGVALWHSRLFRQTDNAHLLALDARSGICCGKSPMPIGTKTTVQLARRL